jgi:hypothetical protein
MLVEKINKLGMLSAVSLSGSMQVAQAEIGQLSGDFHYAGLLILAIIQPQCPNAGSNLALFAALEARLHDLAAARAVLLNTANPSEGSYGV